VVEVFEFPQPVRVHGIGCRRCHDAVRGRAQGGGPQPPLKHRPLTQDRPRPYLGQLGAVHRHRYDAVEQQEDLLSRLALLGQGRARAEPADLRPGAAALTCVELM
jgi:hypothetical protein